VRTNIGGVLATQIYTIDDGFVVIEQAEDSVVMLAPDELLVVIRKLQSHYEQRLRWQEPQPG